VLTLAPHALTGRDVDEKKTFRVLALDAETLQARMDSPCDPGLGARHMLELHADVEPLLGEVVEVVPAPAGPIVDYAVKELPLQAVRELLTLIDRLLARGLAVQNDVGVPREREIIVEPRRIREVVRALMANRFPARAVNAEGRTLMRLVPADIVPEETHPLEWHVEDVYPDLPFFIEITTRFSVFRFAVGRIEARGERMATAVPQHIERTRHRAWTRARPREGEGLISFHHPRWPDLRIRRSLVDVSFDGAAFDTKRLTDILYPGLVIRDLSIQWNDRERFDFQGVVRHTGHPAGGSGDDVAGMLLTPRSEDDGQRWGEHVLRLLSPHTRADGAFSEQVWDLLGRAGYFSLSGKSESDFLPQKAAFARFSRQVACAPGLGSQVVRPSGRGVEGSVSAVRAYEKSTFFFQMARQPTLGMSSATARGQILRDIHVDMLTRTHRASPGTEWFMAMVQDSARFPRLAYYDIPRRYVESGRSLIVPFRALQTKTFEPEAAAEDMASTLPPTVPRGVTFGVATDEERALVCAFLARTRKPIYLDALDLVPDRFDLARVSSEWGKAGLVRKREVLIARSPDAPWAAAIVELVDDGVHLFGLLDAVRLVALRDEAVPDAILTGLLDAARTFYKSHSKLLFTYHFDPNDSLCRADEREAAAGRAMPEHALRAGFQDMGNAFLILLRWELVTEMLEQIDQIVAPRDLPPLPPATP